MPIYNKQRIMLDWPEKANGEKPTCALDEKLTKEQYFKKMYACIAEGMGANFKINNMDRTETEEAIAVMQAWVDGKTIQYRNRADDSAWADIIGTPIWSWTNTQYRVKPTVIYRPYSSEVECMHDILTNHSNSWIKVKGENKYFLLNEISPETNFELMFRSWEYIDGSPFGMKITK